ncbi:MAG: LegC family aminotransferase [Elusimicrobia bacterium]|nr:LegC family aminotransferase [Elusimicrobiota bacterium]
MKAELATMGGQLPMKKVLLPLHEPVFGGNEWRYVKRCLDSTWVSTGAAFVERFEAAVASRLGVRHAVAVVNGTAALHLALEAAGVEAGCEVLAPSLTFIATANSAAYLGARPRFVDADPSTMGLDPVVLQDYLSRKARVRRGACWHRDTGRRVAACLPVHVLGHPPRLDRLLEVCGRWRIPVVEDATESLGSTFQGRAAGTFGLAGALSFNGNKIITTGGGGMVVTDDAATAARLRHLSTQAKKDPVAYVHDRLGYNYRLPGINAALGLAQLEQLDGFVKRKRRVARWYASALAGTDLAFRWEPDGARSNFWLNAVFAGSRDRARRIMAGLAAAGIESRPLWTPCHRQPIFKPPLTAGTLPVTDSLWRATVTLPSSANMTRRDVEAVARVLSSCP